MDDVAAPHLVGSDETMNVLVLDRAHYVERWASLAHSSTWCARPSTRIGTEGGLTDCSYCIVLCMHPGYWGWLLLYVEDRGLTRIVKTYWSGVAARPQQILLLVSSLISASITQIRKELFTQIFSKFWLHWNFEFQSSLEVYDERMFKIVSRKFQSEKSGSRVVQLTRLRLKKNSLWVDFFSFKYS